MKKISNIFFLWVFLSVVFTANAQLINCNPDPDGEPWQAGGTLLTPEALAEIEALPKLTISEQS